MSKVAPRSIILSLGSNLGNRRYQLRRAVTLLSRMMRVVRVSSVYETEPLGSPAAARAFLNCIVLGTTNLSAHELLRNTQEVEAQLGRRRTVPNAPRTIDIDILFYSAVLSSDAALTLPHPRFRERAFVMEPMRELELRWCDPVSGIELHRHTGRGEVKKVDALWSYRVPL